MAEVSESKRLWRTALIVAGVGLVVLVALGWLALRMWGDTIQRRVIAANESATLTYLEGIQAAEDIYFRANGQYGTIQQLIDAGFQPDVGGDPHVAHGYVLTVRVQPRTDAQPSTYSINADPARSGGRDATGRRHFFVSSEVTGIRFNESRPATGGDKPRPKVSEY
ncbi:MAG TPA: hypothetical protein VF621_11725 [Pyrinomonadaceae bacterium]|jgi:type II secretory pathway pseudopilin PulG